MQIVARPEDVGLCTQRLARVTQWMGGWVDSGRLPGLLVAVVRNDSLAWLQTYGWRDIDAKLAVEANTIYRIYSMTKPITTVAALMLYEEGRFQLDDPVAKYIPAFDQIRVFDGGDTESFSTVPLARPITVHDLMVHTSGLTYGFQHEHAVDAMYRNCGVEFNANVAPLADLVEAAAAQPLVFQPGTRWNYSISTDVLGRLVEIWSGVALDSFFNERIFGPLGMCDTGFHVHEEQAHRLASNYVQSDNQGLKLADSASESRFLEPAVTLSGGGGLVSSASDYLRFMRMLRGRGSLEDTRILGRKSVDLMTVNHLPGDLVHMGQARFSEMPFAGVGFGLGVSVLLDPAKARILGSPGEYAWGGMASTTFWVDPAEDLIVLLLTQLMPSSAYPIRRELRVLVYQALL